MKKLKVIKPSRLLEKEEQTLINGGYCNPSVVTSLYESCSTYEIRPCVSYRICTDRYVNCPANLPLFGYCKTPYSF